MLLRYVLLVLFLITGSLGFARAGEAAGVQAAVVGSSVKTLARAFVATADLDEVKAVIIEKLSRMKPEIYRRQYARRYRVIKDLPDGLKKKYGLVEHLPKDRMIAVIRSWDKKKSYEIIEAVPNETLAREVGVYFHAGDKGEKDKGFMQKVQIVWKDVLDDLTRKPALLQR